RFRSRREFFLKDIFDVAGSISPQPAADAGVADAMDAIARPDTILGQSNEGSVAGQFVELEQCKIFRWIFGNDFAFSRPAAFDLCEITIAIGHQRALVIDRE